MHYFDLAVLVGLPMGGSFLYQLVPDEREVFLHISHELPKLREPADVVGGLLDELGSVLSYEEVADEADVDTSDDDEDEVVDALDEVDEHVHSELLVHQLDLQVVVVLH